MVILVIHRKSNERFQNDEENSNGEQRKFYLGVLGVLKY
jgi:hypothetical protein